MQSIRARMPRQGERWRAGGNLTAPAVAGTVMSHQSDETMHSRKLEELIVYLGKQPGVTNLGLTKLWKLI